MKKGGTKKTGLLCMHTGLFKVSGFSCLEVILPASVLQLFLGIPRQLTI